jgi:hypothetical protein
VDDSTPGPDLGENPVKVDGPGPKPIADVAREHGGDAGSAQREGQTADAAAGGNVEGVDEEDGPGAKSKGSGDGTEYVKSTGVYAEGGDFDATKAGAGREADRELSIGTNLPGRIR